MSSQDSSDRDGDIPSLESRVRVVFNDEWPPAMRQRLTKFLEVTGLDEYLDLFNKAMYIAQHPSAFDKNGEGDYKQPELDYVKGDEQRKQEFPPEHPARSLTISDRDRYMLQLDASPVKQPSQRARSRLPSLVMPDRRKWHDLPDAVKHVILVCGLGATVQGVDEAVVNGAQGLYLKAFGIELPSAQAGLDDAWRAGLINAAPYLCCIVSCWFTPWLNRLFGRRGTIFVCALFSLFFAFAQAFAKTWQELVVFRLLMGIGIGPKSATIPIYAAETAPANIRGSLVTCWQACTALGIAVGCAFSAILHLWGAFQQGDSCNFQSPEKSKLELLSLTCSWNWRVILAFPALPPLCLILLIYFCKESPRWSVAKAHGLYRRGQPNRSQSYYRKAFKDLRVLSRSDLLAARDMFIHFFFLEKEYEETQKGRDNPSQSWVYYKLRQLFGKGARRNRRAITASTVCMVAQQLCGVNILIYYSNYVLGQVDHNDAVFNRSALLHTMGFGIVNFVLALPAFLLIDIMGRRTLLLTTFPFLAVSHLIMACASTLPQGSKGKLFLAGFYLFCAFYSPGEGPVPFVYASESMPLAIRDEGMGLVTSINWLLNWFVAFTAPYQFEKLGMGGTFGLYSGFCVILWITILLLVPETRLLTLEQLDYVFHEVASFDFAKHAISSLKYHLFLTGSDPGSIYDQGQHGEGRLLRRSTTVALEAGISHVDSNRPTDQHFEMTSTIHPQSHVRDSSEHTRTEHESN